MDTSFLLGARGIEAPDMLRQGMQAATLGDLIGRGQIQQYALKSQQRNDATQEAVNRALPGVMQGGWSQEAIQAAIQANPDAAGGLLAELDKRQKSQADLRKTNAGAAKDEVEAKAKAMNDLGNVAYGFAQNPTPNSLPMLQSMAKFYGVQLPDHPGDPRDPGALQQYFKSIGDMAYAVKDRIVNAETATHNRATEAQGTASLGQQMTIAQMNDARARELAAAARDQARATREAANSTRTQQTEMKIADDYRTQSKGFQETAGAIRKARIALETADTNPGSALAAGTAFMKILDPNSVVRESELGMALNASGWFDRALNLTNTLRNGKIMTATQKANLGAAIDDLWAEAQAVQREVDKSYGDRTKRYGGNPENVLLDLGQNAAPAPKASAPAGWGPLTRVK